MPFLLLLLVRFFLWFVKVNSANVRTASAATVMTSLAGGRSKGANIGMVSCDRSDCCRAHCGYEECSVCSRKNVKFSVSSIRYLHPKRLLLHNGGFATNALQTCAYTYRGLSNQITIKHPFQTKAARKVWNL